MRSIFAKAALAAFVGFAVLGSFTGVAGAFLATILGVHNHFTIGLIVFVVFASSTVGQLLLSRTTPLKGMRAGCAALVLGLAVIFASLAAESLPLLVIGGVVAGLGQGLSFRAGLFTVNAAAPAERRAEVASSFFVVAFVALSIPVIGIGVLAELANLRTAGLVFSALVAVLAATGFVLLAREPDPPTATQ
jgi:MFS family permease